MAQSFNTTDVLRLEVESDPTGLVNLVQNPNGELGGYGWVTPVSGSTMTGDGTNLTYTTVASVANYFYSEPLPVTAGDFIAASWKFVTDAGGHIRARFEWLNSSYAVLSNSAQTGDLVDSASTQGIAPLAIPASTVYARLRFDVYTGDTGTGNVASALGRVIREVTVLTAATSAELGVRTNAIPNPSFAADTKGWAAYAGVTSISRTTAQAYSGTSSLAITCAGGTYAQVISLAAPAAIPVTGGTTYTVSVYSRAAATARSVNVGVWWYNDAGTFISGTGEGANNVVGSWTRRTATLTAPSSATYARPFVSFGTSGVGGYPAAGEIHYVDAFQFEGGSSATTYFDGDTTDTGSETYEWLNAPNVVISRTNLWTNPSLETNATGWSYGTVGSGTVARSTAQFSVGTASLLVTGTALQNYLTAKTPTGTSGMAVTAGEKYSVKASFRLHSNFTADNQLQIQYTWYDSAGAQLSSVSYVTTSDVAVNTWTTTSHSGATAPANAAYLSVCLRAAISTGNFASGTTMHVDALLVEQSSTAGAYFDGATADGTADYTVIDRAWTGTAHASTSTETTTVTLPYSKVTSSTVGFAGPIEYLNILGESQDLAVTRQELNVGTLTGTVISSTLDPSQEPLLRPGRRCRVSVLESGIWQPIYTGKLDNAKVTYELKNPSISDEKRARIELTAVDNIGTLSRTSRPSGVANIGDLPYVLEGAQTPWNVNGNGNQVVSATVVSTNDSATALDQVAVTRDSKLGYAWVDQVNTMQVWDKSAKEALETANLYNYGTFENSGDEWLTVSYTVLRSNEQVRTGSNALKVTKTTAVAATLLDSTSHNVQKIIPGQSYTVAAYTRAATTGRSCYMVVWWYDADGVVIGSGTSGGTATNNTSGWALHSYTVTAPANAAQMRLGVGITSTTSGEVHYIDDVTVTGLTAVDMSESVYSDLQIDYDSGRCINSVTVKYLRYTDGQTTEVLYGPYEDSSSISNWGRHSAEFTIHGITESEANMSAFASSVLAANATPQIRINSVTVPIRSTEELANALHDLYTRVRVQNLEAGIVAAMRVTGVKHTITPEKWLVTYDFATANGVAQPQLIPAVTRDEPYGGPVRIGDIVMSGRSDESFGFVKANGQSLSTTAYPALFAAYGYTYGGSGSSFNVPNMTDVFPIGAGTKALGTSGGSTTSSVPAHTHPLDAAASLTLGAGAIRGDRVSTSFNSDWTITATGISGVASGPTAETVGTGVTGTATSGGSATINVLNPWRALNFFVKAR